MIEVIIINNDCIQHYQIVGIRILMAMTDVADDDKK